ncbi:hypothetical protein C0W42_21560 [Photobacterium kishitanii]|uniref:hypothetical protein n=1 Tax=Photobacterium kishitanii TaxID=318456 RepID=UPI000D172ACA|nr:hypothetical protein [Photobacterium kishitanii]PSU85081.1 hypothetical protein C0W42_21560 [Photobacterium kishitanii]
MINLNDYLDSNLSIVQLIELIEKLTKNIANSSYVVEEYSLISEKAQYLKQAADAIIVKNELACVDAGDEQEMYSLHNIETGEIESSNFYCTYAAAFVGLSLEARYRGILSYQIKSFDDE